MGSKNFYYHDRIYGAYQINEPVLLDLLQSRAILRLQGVLQHGITGLLGITRATTRYEHSLGVMCLVRRLGASLDEQIAALLHDISHTAFSHVIDYVFGDGLEQSYHEIHKETYLASTDLPGLLSKHNYDWRKFLQEEDFSLLEQPAPALCADRLDYFLRDAYDLGLAKLAEIQATISHLVVFEGRIVVDDLQVAQWLASTFLRADQASWANFREVGLYELTARAIRYGLAQGVIDDQDIWETDQLCWQKLLHSQDPGLKKQMERINPSTQFTWDAQRAEFWVGAKLRSIDPPVLLHGRSQSLSELDPVFARQRQDYHEKNAGKWPFYVEPGLL